MGPSLSPFRATLDFNNTNGISTPINSQAASSTVITKRLLDAGTGQEGHDHRSGRIGEEPPGPEFGVNVTKLYAHLDRWQALEGVMRRLPLTAPLNYFHVTSSFGKRCDPVNRRWAMHYGVDLVGTFKSSVYFAAPGVVTYVGWNGKYGRLIEVDHGAPSRPVTATSTRPS